MRTFSTLVQLAHYINRYHWAFGNLTTAHTLSVLGDMNRMMLDNFTIRGMTFPAYQTVTWSDGKVETLKTYITINKAKHGGWEYFESTTPYVGGLSC